MERMLADLNTDERNILHDDPLQKENTLSAYRSPGGGDHLIKPRQLARARYEKKPHMAGLSYIRLSAEMVRSQRDVDEIPTLMQM